MAIYGPAHWDAARLLIMCAHRTKHYLEPRELARSVRRWPTVVAVEAVELLGLEVQPWVVIDICDSLTDALDGWAHDRPF